MHSIAAEDENSNAFSTDHHTSHSNAIAICFWSFPRYWPKELKNRMTKKIFHIFFLKLLKACSESPPWAQSGPAPHRDRGTTVILRRRDSSIQSFNCPHQQMSLYLPEILADLPMWGPVQTNSPQNFSHRKNKIKFASWFSGLQVNITWQ